MLIDVPVYIAVDQSSRPGCTDRPSIEASFMLRIDTTNDSAPLMFAKVYSSKIGKFYEDTGDVFAHAFDTNDYKRLIARAEANPADYCADVTEGERLQAELDARRDALAMI